jgi:hypothetical protein
MAFQWEHEEDCKFYMGRPFSQVHAYLDECVKIMVPVIEDFAIMLMEWNTVNGSGGMRES